MPKYQRHDASECWQEEMKCIKIILYNFYNLLPTVYHFKMWISQIFKHDRWTDGYIEQGTGRKTIWIQYTLCSGYKNIFYLFHLLNCSLFLSTPVIPPITLLQPTPYWQPAGFIIMINGQQIWFIAKVLPYSIPLIIYLTGTKFIGYISSCHSISRTATKQLF